MVTDTLKRAMGATDEEVAEVEALASNRSVLHWAPLLSVIQRMRNAEASADHAWQRVEAGDNRYQSLEADFMALQDKSAAAKASLAGRLETALHDASRRNERVHKAERQVADLVKALQKISTEDDGLPTYTPQAMVQIAKRALVAIARATAKRREDLMMTYEIDSKLRGPEELGSDRGIPADWHVDLVDREHKPAHYIVMQFGSINVSRDEASGIVTKILAGLNSEAAS